MKRLIIIFTFYSFVLLGCNNYDFTLVGGNKWKVCGKENLQAGTYYFSDAMHTGEEHVDPSKRHLNDYPIDVVRLGKWLYLNQPTPIMSTSIIKNKGLYKVGNKDHSIELKCGDKIMLNFGYEVTLKKIK